MRLFKSFFSARPQSQVKQHLCHWLEGTPGPRDLDPSAQICKTRRQSTRGRSDQGPRRLRGAEGQRREAVKDDCESHGKVKGLDCRGPAALAMTSLRGGATLPQSLRAAALLSRSQREGEGTSLRAKRGNRGGRQRRSNPVGAGEAPSGFEVSPSVPRRPGG